MAISHCVQMLVSGGLVAATDQQTAPPGHRIASLSAGDRRGAYVHSTALHRDSLLHVPIRERDGNKSEGAAVLTDPRYDAVLAGSLLRRRGMRIVTGAVLLVVLAFAAVIQLSALVNMRSDIAGVFLKALFLSSFLTIVPIAVLWFLDRREREGTWLFDAAFLWGGFIATALSLPFNNAFFQLVDDWVAQNPAITGVLGPDAAAMIAAPISAPIVEEIAKALGVLAIFWVARAEFDGMRDGFVYGAAVGVGFNWSEAALYVAQGYAESGVAPYGTELGARYALFGLGGHALFTGMLGLCLGLAVQTNRRWLRVLAPIIGIVLAIAAHRLINSLPLRAALEQARTGVPVDSHQGPAEAGFLDAFLRGSINQLAILLPFMLMTALALWRSGVWERRVIREELGSEIGRAVTPGEYEGIAQDDILRTRRVSGMQRGASSALVKAQNELAFRKRRVRADGKTPSTIILSDDGEKRSSACGNCRHEAPIPAPPSGEMGSAAGPSD